MNLIDGKTMDAKDSLACLDNIPEYIKDTLQGVVLDIDEVINACDNLSKWLTEEDHLPMLLAMGMKREKAEKELKLVKRMMSREYLQKRMEMEFGAKRSDISFGILGENRKVRQGWRPLGVLMHIAAGNVDALPVFSVIEGLLTGNINILKLPGSDDGLSIAVLHELIEVYPLIRKYVYVFDYPSSDIASMRKMADVSDALIVWGGDEAVMSVRKMAGPDTRIIEWGHKISFAYVSGKPEDKALEEIAFNICDTEQLYCNSCQGVYLDTDDFNEVCRFAKRFAGVLDKVSMETGDSKDQYLAAKKSLEIRVEELESCLMDKQIFKSMSSSVIAYSDQTLGPSYMFRNCWVRPLCENEIINMLHNYKNHLQTAALICSDEDRGRLEKVLFRAGITRITNGINMSSSYCGQPHDGDFPLRRYMKRVSVEY